MLSHMRIRGLKLCPHIPGYIWTCICIYNADKVFRYPVLYRWMSRKEAFVFGCYAYNVLCTCTLHMLLVQLSQSTCAYTTSKRNSIQSSGLRHRLHINYCNEMSIHRILELCIRGHTMKWQIYVCTCTKCEDNHQSNAPFQIGT